MKEETRIKINDNEMCIKGIDEVPMFSWNTKTKEFYVLGHKFDGINSIEDFINYIHNLDKENKSLQSQLKSKEDLIKEVTECIKNFDYYDGEISDDIENIPFKYVIDTDIEGLLEILSKGENK